MEVRIYKNVRFFSYLQSAKTSIPICVQLNDLVQEIPGPCSDPWSTSGGFVNSEHVEQDDYVENEDLLAHYRDNCSNDKVCTPNLTHGCKAIYSIHVAKYRYCHCFLSFLIEWQYTVL